MPRYVILRHELPAEAERPSHWDLMLEAGDVLRTWALAREPEASKTIQAEPLPDHRLHYLEYEGPVSGDRGHVTRWDAGTYETLEESSSRLTVQLAGERLRGTAVLRTSADETQCVEFVFEP